MRLVRGNKQQLSGVYGAVVGTGGDVRRQQRGGGAGWRQQHN